MSHSQFIMLPHRAIAVNVVTGDERGTKETNAREIAVAMVGRELKDIRARQQSGESLPVLEVSRLEALSDRGEKALKGVDLVVREGEVLGVAGVGGNGQSELAQCI